MAGRRLGQVLLRLAAVLALASGGTVAVPAPLACACSCVGYGTREAMRAADAVFDAEVLDRTQPTGSSSMDPVHYSLRVTRVYKGSVPLFVTVSSAVSEASCGLTLRGRVIVFARATAGGLTTSLCSGPTRLDRAELGQGIVPVPASQSPSGATTAAPGGSAVPTNGPTSQSPPNWTLLVAGLAVATTAGFGWLWWRRRAG